MPSIKILSAQRNDDKELVTFSSNFPSEGGLKLALDRSPSYFDSLSQEGSFPEIIIGRETNSGEMVGVGHRTESDFYWKGTKTKLGILSGLRLLKQYRSGIALARGYQKLKEIQNRNPLPGSLTTIQSENKIAIKILTSGRASLPHYHYLDELITFVWKPKVGEGKNQYSIRDFSQTKEELELWESKRVNSFLTPILPNSIFTKSQYSRYTVYKNQTLVSVLGLWDQSGWKRWRVLGYTPTWKLFRLFYNLWAKLNHLPFLPKEKEPLHYVFLSQLKITEIDHKELEPILKKILEKTKQVYPNAYLCYTVSKKDPWFHAFQKIPAWKIKSLGYFVHWESESPLDQISETGFTEWETGLL